MKEPKECSCESHWWYLSPWGVGICQGHSCPGSQTEGIYSCKGSQVHYLVQGLKIVRCQESFKFYSKHDVGAAGRKCKLCELIWRILGSCWSVGCWTLDVVICTYLIIGLMNTEQCLFALLLLFRLREQADCRISSQHLNLWPNLNPLWNWVS